MNKKKSRKKYGSRIVIWLFLVMGIFSLYQIYPHIFSIDFLQIWTERHWLIASFLYVLLLSCLGLFFIPSTPFALSGVIIFGPMRAYVFNLIGIITSSTIVYHFAQFLGLDIVLQEKYPKQIQTLHKALQKKELPIIIGRSLFPVVPTDLIIYVSSCLGIPLRTCLLGVLLGEGLLNCIYIFGTGYVLERLFFL